MPKGKVQLEVPRTSSSLTLTEDDLPEISNFKVGDTYHILLQVQQTGADSHPDAEGDLPSEARFKVLSAKVMGDKGKKDQTQQDQGSMEDMVDNSQDSQEMMNGSSDHQKALDQMHKKAQQY